MFGNFFFDNITITLSFAALDLWKNDTGSDTDISVSSETFGEILKTNDKSLVNV